MDINDLSVTLAEAMSEARFKNDAGRLVSKTTVFQNLTDQAQAKLILNELEERGWYFKNSNIQECNEDNMPLSQSNTLDGQTSLSTVFNIEIPDITPNSGKYIVKHLFPKFIEKFVRKNNAYGDSPDDLGVRGMFPDINRKTNRLKRDIWDGQRPPKDLEPTQEVINDLIGHLFLVLYRLEMGD